MVGGSFGVSQLRGGGWGFLDGEDLWSSGDGIRDQEGGGGARGVLSGGMDGKGSTNLASRT